MARTANLVRVYRTADADTRVELIIQNYDNFVGIIDGYTDGLRYMIENEKEYNRHAGFGDPGMRVQSGGMHSDPTANQAIRNVITRDALIACDFFGDVLEGVDHPEQYKQEAFTLRLMRKDYALFNCQLDVLGPVKEEFLLYLKKVKNISDLAEENNIEYRSAQKRITRAKKILKQQMVIFLDGHMGGAAV